MTYTDEQFAKLSGAYAVKVLETMDQDELYKFAYDMLLDSFVGDTADDLRKEIAQIYDNDTLKELCEICQIPFVAVSDDEIDELDQRMHDAIDATNEVNASDVDVDVTSEVVQEENEVK